MANNGQYPGMQPFRPPLLLGPTHVGPRPCPPPCPPPVPIQFRPAVAVPPQPSQPYNPLAPRQFQQVGFTNIGLPPHVQQYHFQPLPVRPLPQPLPSTEVQNRANISVSPRPLPNVQIANNYVIGSSSFTYGVSSLGQPQPQNQSASDGAVKESNPIKKPQSIWLEHTARARNGKKFYYNRRTKKSYWEKPLELMTPIERADATTDWGEFKSPDGKKYYYNKVTKISKWRMPDELKLAREQVMLASNLKTQGGKSTAPAAVSLPIVEAPPPGPVASSLGSEVVLNTLKVEDVSPVASPQPEAASLHTTGTEAVPMEVVAPTAVVSGSADSSNPPVVVSQIEAAQDAVGTDVASGVNEEAEKDKKRDGDANITAPEETKAVEEPVVYETKLEAKSAFKALLESANVGSDWTWDQAMRAIINDRRYGALRTLTERKQAFSEFLMKRKKQEAEERRARHKKALEDFRKMLEESKELTSSSRWSKVAAIFEDDERFTAVERNKEREDIFDAYIAELQKKDKAKALEVYKRNKAEYRSFLKSCDFITASSQWRRIQDRLEDDERCLRLDKIDRLEIFQEYVRELEREEEEQLKLRMEERRRAERKNREEFRNLMEEHIASGMLTAQTHWRDYCMEVNTLPAYVAVSSNTSGATAKELFEDVLEELQKQFLEDKARIRDAVMWRKVALSSTWTLEDFRSSISVDISSPPISDINLRLVFEELLAAVKEKEEKEAKRRKRLADEFYDHLWTIKSISSSSTWEDCKKILEDRQENRFLGEESHLVETFDKFISELQEKAKERERRRKEDKAKREREAKEKEKEKEREKEKEKEKERKRDRHNRDKERVSESKSRKDKDSRHSKRESDYVDVLTVDEDERDRSKSFGRHSSDFKRQKQGEHYGTEADNDSRSKRHKKDQRRGSSHKNSGDHEEHRGSGEDGELR